MIQPVIGMAALVRFPRMTHGLWEPAYGEPALWRWLLEQRRVTPAP